MERAVLCSDEWAFYLEHGSLINFYEKGAIPGNMITATTNILQLATRELIFKSCSNSIADEIRSAVENGKCDSSGMTILKYLESKFSDPMVLDLFPFFKKLSQPTTMSLVERLDFVEKFIIKVRNIPKGKEDEFAAFFLLGLSPELHDSSMSALGRNRTLSTKDILSLGQPESSDTAMFSRAKPWKKDHKNRKDAKPRKPCPACHELHFLSDCPLFKAALSEYKAGKEGKSLRENACNPRDGQKTDDSWVSFLSEENMDKPNLTNSDWVLDSGSTCHVCHDRDLFTDFKPCHGRTITGIAGSVKVEGEGLVKIGDKTLHNVAYVPSIPVNLISMKAATRRSGSAFILDSTGVYVKAGETLKKVGSLKNGLYIYDLGDKRQTPTVFTVASAPTQRKSFPNNLSRMEQATTESDSMSTMQDSDIDHIDDGSSRPKTPDSLRSSFSTPTFNFEATRNLSTDANVDHPVQIIKEQNRLLPRAKFKPF